MNKEPFSNQTLTVRERLDLFFERLEKAPPCTSAGEALLLVCRTLEEVEDEFSGIPKNPNPGLKFDGRMYPPRADYMKPQSDGGQIAQTKGHEVRLGVDGSISIQERTSGQEQFTKQGGRP